MSTAATTHANYNNAHLMLNGSNGSNNCTCSAINNSNSTFNYCSSNTATCRATAATATNHCRSNYSDNCSSGSATNLYQFLCIVCICLICYYNSTQCGLVFDDISAVRDNKDLRPSTPLRNIFLNDFWGTPMRKEHSHKSYRPLTVLTFRLNYMLHELEPYGYHLVNVLLHIGVCLLWRRVSRLLLWQCNNGADALSECERRAVAVHRLSPRTLNRCSFVATLLFAVHPIHTEAVTGVVGRAELLSSICFLAAFLAYAGAVTAPSAAGNNNNSNNALSAALARRRAAAQHQLTRWLPLTCNFISCLLASMLCKEQGITIAGICAAYELFVVQQVRPLDVLHYMQQLFEERQLNSPSVKTASTAASVAKLMPPQTSPAAAFALRWRRAVLVKRLCYLVVVTLALLAGRVYVMGSQLPVFTRFDNPASVADTPARQLTFSYLIYLNSWLLLFPSYLCCDWTMGTVPIIEGFSDARNVATLFTFGTLVALGLRACFTRSLPQSRVLLMCLAWLVLPFLPASNLFFPVGFVVAERILYMPSMGFCLLVAYGYAQLEQLCRRRKLTTLKYLTQLTLGLLLLTHAYKTYQRNWDWRSDYTLFMSGMHVNVKNAKLFNNVGHALEHEERYTEALAYFQQAALIQPDDIGAHINVGRTYNKLQLYAKAEQAYLKAKALFPKIKSGESYQARIAPNHLNVFINLANLIAKNETRLEEADQLYRQAISMRADYVQAYINRGDILMKLNRTAQAQEVYEKALFYDSENADIYYNLGVVFLEQGKSAQAQVYFNKAIDLYPEHEQALLNSAILLQELGGAEARRLSRERLNKVLTRDVQNEKVYFNLGMLAMDEGNFDDAEQYFKRAIHLKENFRSALFNLALLLADANRPLDAVPYLNQLIRHHVDHIKGLILLGDIYINHMKDLDAAEACYRSILKYEPHNIQGLHNLCVVFVERKRLAKATACLKFVHQLAPAEDYILRHLQIVETRLQKIAKLSETTPERQAAFADYDPLEFKIPRHTLPQKF